jgi:hypothetical protein
VDQRERWLNEPETFRLAMQANQSRLWTSLPCVVKQYPAASGLSAMALDAQPVINGVVRTTEGTFTPIQMPVVLDCPILWQGGGGVTATFPIRAGDECLVVFAARCIDAWFQQGWQAGSASQANPAMNPPDLRMHSLSDGFALVGLRSIPQSITPDLLNACLISDDGETYYKLNPTAKTIAVQASGGITLNGCTIDSSGNFNCPATITATTDVFTGGVSLKTHPHSGVTTGGDTSGPPVP